VKKPQSNKKEQLKTYAKYSALSFQMLIIILIGAFGGLKIDRWLGFQFPIFTLVLTVASVVFAVYYAIKDFLK